MRLTWVESWSSNLFRICHFQQSVLVQSSAMTIKAFDLDPGHWLQPKRQQYVISRGKMLHNMTFLGCEKDKILWHVGGWEDMTEYHVGSHHSMHKEPTQVANYKMARQLSSIFEWHMVYWFHLNHVLIVKANFPLTFWSSSTVIKCNVKHENNSRA